MGILDEVIEGFKHDYATADGHMLCEKKDGKVSAIM